MHRSVHGVAITIAKVPKPHVSGRVLLLLGQPEGQTTQFHNQPAHWASLGSLLRACDARSRVVTDDIRVLTPESLATFDVIVNASTALRPSDREFFAVQSRIDAGAGYVGVHVANTVHLASPNFLHAVDVAPPPKNALAPTMSVRIPLQVHLIIAGLEDYDHDDEFYEITGGFGDRPNLVTVREDCTLATADGHPMVYVTTHGNGRVVFLASGHDRRSPDHPTFRTLSTRTVDWVSPCNR